jgi:hypothetical protein
MVSYNEIKENNYILSKDGLKWIEFNKSINILKEKYLNILEILNRLTDLHFLQVIMLPSLKT